MKGWYEDHDLYHRIGYLITSGTSLHKIFALSKDKKKSEFNESLDELIKRALRFLEIMLNSVMRSRWIISGLVHYCFYSISNR